MNFKIFILFLLLWFCCSKGQLLAQADYTLNSKYRSLEEAKDYFVLRDSSYLYQAPSFRAIQLESLSPGATVKIEERLDELTTRNGLRTNWYRVSFQKDNKTIQGFIWGGLIAFQAVASVENPSIRFICGIESIQMVSRGSYSEQVIYLKVVVLNQQKILDSISIEAIGSLYTNASLKPYGNRGLFSIQDVVELNFSDGYCGGVSASITFFWDGIRLHYIDLLSNGYSATSFHNRFFIYPSESGGKARRIILREERGTYDDSKVPSYQFRQNKLFGWNGKGLYILD
jgi:hypothetical protein